jgi:hypothetical protein
MYFIDQLINPDSIVIHFGGIHGIDVLLCGSVSSASTSPESKRLFGLLKRNLRQHATTQKGHWMDEDSIAKAKSGWRLTGNIAMTPASDLRLD